MACLLIYALCAFLQILEVCAVCNDDNDCVRVSGSLDRLAVKVQELLSLCNLLSAIDECLEAIAIHSDCIDPNVNQDFNAVLGSNANSVLCREKHCDFAIERSIDQFTIWLDANGRTHGFRSKHRISNLGCRNHLSIDRKSNNALLCCKCILGRNYFWSRCCFFLFVPEEECQCKCNAASDRKKDRVAKRILSDQIAWDTCNAIGNSTNLEDCAKQCTNCTTSRCEYKWLHESQVDTEDRRLGNSKGSREGRRNRNCLCLSVLCFDTNSKASTKLREVGSGSNRHPCVQCASCEHAKLDCVVHVVKTHDNSDRIYCTHDARANRVRYQCGCE